MVAILTKDAKAVIFVVFIIFVTDLIVAIGTTFSIIDIGFIKGYTSTIYNMFYCYHH